MAKDIAKENGVDPRRSASILDIFSCVWQGIIPYGAQLLLAGSIAKISPIQIMSGLYYTYLLGIAVIVAIFLGFPKAKPKAVENK
jgi:Na+/H+ antiporter NhaC